MTLTRIVAATALLAGLALAQAQTLNMAKALDSPHYDSQRTTWSPTSDVTHMIQDTLVALDWDGKTAVPLLAKSWTVSPDGKLFVMDGRIDQLGSQKFGIACPSSRVIIARSTAGLVVLETKRTDPSAMRTFTPPGWDCCWPGLAM